MPPLGLGTEIGMERWQSTESILSHGSGAPGKNTAKMKAALRADLFGMSGAADFGKRGKETVPDLIGVNKLIKSANLQNQGAAESEEDDDAVVN